MTAKPQIPNAENNQRRHSRHDIPLAGYLQSGGVVVPCRVQNISAGGALVEADAGLRLGDWATIKIPDFGSMTGRVVRVTSTFVGLSFADGEAAVDAFILEWLALNANNGSVSDPENASDPDDPAV